MLEQLGSPLKKTYLTSHHVQKLTQKDLNVKSKPIKCLQENRRNSLKLDLKIKTSVKKMKK